MRNLQVTLAIIKPDASQTPFALNVIKSYIEREKLKIITEKILRLKRDEVENFYEIHRKKFFYNRLVTFMNSGPIHAMILSSPNAIKVWRDIMGPTKSFQAHLNAPNTIRGIIGLSDSRNCVHGSDSVENAKKEIGCLFPDFNIEKWKLQQQH